MARGPGLPFPWLWRSVLTLAVGAAALSAGLFLGGRGLGPVVPPPAGALAWGASFPGPQGQFSYAGAVHVHTRASRDARADLPDVVAAAHAAGLSFLVTADHDAQRSLGEPLATVQDGVLVVRAAEWSTEQGHLLDLSVSPGLGPFRSGSAALADCRRRGGPCVAAHPSSRRRPWEGPWRGLDGLEIHSAMTAAGDLVRPPYAALLAFGWHVLASPSWALWEVGALQEDALALLDAHPEVPAHGSCGADLHGHLPLRENLLGFLTVVGFPKALPADPAAAAAALLPALPGGACANALAGWVDGLTLVQDGAELLAQAQVRGPSGPTRLRLWRGRTPLAQAALADGVAGQVRAAAQPGLYRATVETEAPLPWGGTQVAAVRVLRVEAGAP